MVRHRPSQDDEGFEKIKSLFTREKALNLDWSPDPFFDSRVLASLDAAANNKPLAKSLVFWRMWSAFSSAAVVALLVTVLTLSRPDLPDFEASSDTALIVDVNIKELTGTNIAEVHIDLPEGVYFFSKSHKEVNNRRSLVVAWQDRPDDESLPFIIRSEESGMKTIELSFFDANKNLINKRQMRIRFMQSTKGKT